MKTCHVESILDVIFVDLDENLVALVRREPFDPAATNLLFDAVVAVAVAGIATITAVANHLVEKMSLASSNFDVIQIVKRLINY